MRFYWLARVSVRSWKQGRIREIYCRGNEQEYKYFGKNKQLHSTRMMTYIGGSQIPVMGNVWGLTHGQKFVIWMMIPVKNNPNDKFLAN